MTVKSRVTVTLLQGDGKPRKGDGKFERFPPICGSGRVTIPPRGVPRKCEPFLRPCEPMALGAGLQAVVRTGFERCRASVLCTGSANLRGMKKMQEKGLASKCRPARPQRRAKPAAIAFVRIGKRSQNNAVTQNQGSKLIFRANKPHR